MKYFTSRTLFLAVPAVLAFATLALGSCIDGNSCDIIPDGVFAKGWSTFMENWNVQINAADDVTILSKLPDIVLQKHGSKCNLEKPILKLSAPPGGNSSIESKKVAIPKSGAILLSFSALAYEGGTKGSIRFETAASRLIWEIQLSAITPGSWQNFNLSYVPLAGENFIIIKASIDAKASATSSSVYISNIHACLADTTLVKRDMLFADVRHKGWATCGGARYSSNNDGAGVVIPNSPAVGYLRFPGGSSENSISRKFQFVVGVTYLIKGFIGLPENEGAIKLYINDIEQETVWSKDNLNNGVFTAVHTSVRQEGLITFAKLNSLTSSKSDIVVHQLNITAINCFAPKFLA